MKRPVTKGEMLFCFCPAVEQRQNRVGDHDVNVVVLASADGNSPFSHSLSES